MSDIHIRPMRADDADAVTEVTIDAFASAADRSRSPADEPNEQTRALMRRRLAHSVDTDPAGRDGRGAGAPSRRRAGHTGRA